MTWSISKVKPSHDLVAAAPAERRAQEVLDQERVLVGGHGPLDWRRRGTSSDRNCERSRDVQELARLSIVGRLIVSDSLRPSPHRFHEDSSYDRSGGNDVHESGNARKSRGDVIGPKVAERASKRGSALVASKSG
jgi:hypothetical protein